MSRFRGGSAAGSDRFGASTTIGVLGGKHDATVDRRGMVAPRSTTWELDWWIGADDRWHVPKREAAVRQHLVDGMPVVQTAMRVPSGDAVQRVYGAPNGDVGEVAVVEISNESPAPFVAALVLRGAAGLDLDGATVYADGRSAIRTSRPPSRWAASIDGSTEETVTSGNATDGPFAHRQDRGARLVGAFLYPVAHRTTLRAVVSLGTQGIGATQPGTLPDADAVRARWRAQLDRGLRVELPDEQLQRAVETARVATVLAGQAWRVEPEVAAVLEDWGLDAEAAAAWGRLTGRARRKLRRREPDRATWPAVLAGAADPDARLLAAVAVAARTGARRQRGALRRLAERVDRSVDRRARRTDAPRAGVVLGALARCPPCAAVGRTGRHDVHCARTRPRLVVDRGARRGAAGGVRDLIGLRG